MKPILITGGTGFLGRHLLALLQARDPNVPLRLLCRNRWTAPTGPNIELIEGDITDAEDVDRAMQGAGQVYHLAGFVSRQRADNWRVYQVHVDGTRYLCEAALRHQPEKIVHVSSSGTIAVSKEPSVHDETACYKHDVIGQWAYYLSKIYSEKLAITYKLPLVVMNPALLLGPGDERNSSTGDVSLFLKGGVRAMPSGGMSFVDARDVASALLAAMEKGRPGERYLLGGPNWSFRKIIEEVSRISGVPAPKLQPGLTMSLASARVLRTLRPSLEGLDDDTIQMASLFWYCDSSKAKRELGFMPRDPLATLRDTVEDIRRRPPS